MSLGIIARWRVRPLRLGPSIPRVSLLLPSRLRAQPPAPFSCHYSTSPAPNTTSSTQEHPKPASNNEYDGDGSVTRSASDLTTSQAIPSSSPTESLVFEDIDYVEDELPIASYKDAYLSDDMMALEADLERGRFAGSVLVKHPTRASQRIAARERLREHHKSVTAQVRHAKMQSALQTASTDWRQVLLRLAQNTPMQSLHWINEGLKVDVPRAAMDVLLAKNGDYTIGAIRRRTGAVIMVSRDQPALLLSGTARAINGVINELRGVADTMTMIRLHSPSSGKKPQNKPQALLSSFYELPPTREEGFRPHHVSTDRHISSIPVPAIWTTATVEQFVTQLVDSAVRPHLHGPLYKPTPGKVLVDHERATVERIERVFHANPSMQVASRSALKLALQNMCNKGDKYLPEARSIFMAMDRRGLTADVDIYNIFLMAACKAGDLRKFQRTLGLMHHRDLHPNLDTWLIFLRMVQSSKVRSYILQAMHSKNLLALPGALEKVAGAMAVMDAEHAVTRKKDIATFFSEQQARYGADWLSREAANQIIDVFGTHGRFEDAFSVLNALIRRYEEYPNTQRFILDRMVTRPDASTFTSILIRARNYGKMPVAVNAVRKMKRPSLHRLPYNKIMHVLFEMAWKLRLRTTLVVLWRYASLARITSWRMRERVSLLLRGSPDPLSKDSWSSTYNELGGEKLAQEFAGGPAALARIRAMVRKAWGSGSVPLSELGVLATKALPLAYGDFSPGIALGDVLSQSVLLDFRCINARKSEEKLQDVLQSAKVKTLPLLPRSSDLEGRADVAPYHYTAAQRTAIGPQDKWDDQSASEGWEFGQKVWPQDQPSLSEAQSSTATSADAGGNNPSKNTLTFAEHGLGENTSESVALSHSPLSTIEEGQEKHMVIINPRLWAAKDPGQEYRNGMQRQEEELIIAVLNTFEKEQMGPRQMRSESAHSSKRSETETSRGLDSVNGGMVALSD
ncbi:hypothetical protein BD289DRAFT_439814 [Coniella lustricola]|uniref:Pentatricopeptide repeat domain-containing protein n=1 Tax=Coniella lustricola TaxID=2025994 RepID=A0A2T3A1B3_9PEZI|nr:hypothetical protein BD289DRAFT_439814 [Coniella lustricola]